jgi:transposase
VRELRELVRYRARMVCLRSGLKAQVKSVLAKHCQKPPVKDLWWVKGPAWLDELELPDAYLVRIDSLRNLVAAFDEEIAVVEEEIDGWLADDVGYQAIQAIPGVGPVLGAIFCAEIGDVSRFPNPAKLCQWAGLTPKHRESDVKVRRGKITKQGSTLVRWAAIEAVSKGRGGPKLKADYQRLSERKPTNVARVAVARKLLTLIFYGLRDGHIRCLEQAKAG